MNFDYEYNFDQLDLTELHKEFGFTPKELISVFENDNSRQRIVGGYTLNECIFIHIGYSSGKRIVMIATTYPNHTINFIGATLPTEEDITNYYCKG